MVHVSSRRRRLIIINNGEKIMKKRTTLKLKPEAIKPGLNVLVDWYRDDTLYYPGVVI